MNRDQLYICLAKVGKLVESPERLRIVDALCQAERSVESISSVTGLPFRTVSHHLQKLTDYGFLERRKDGRRVIYSITGVEITAFLETMKSLAENLFPEIPLAINESGRNRVKSENDANCSSPVIIDLRPVEEYRNAHVPGAISIPFMELTEKLHLIPEGSPVLAYCRDKYCDLADRAVRLLEEKGYKAWRLEDGVTARQTDGRPVTRERTGK